MWNHSDECLKGMLEAHQPTSISSTPVKQVARVIASRVVVTITRAALSFSASSAPGPADTRDATLVDMADRNIKPTSCTCPIAKGSVLKKLMVTWWMAELRKANRASGHMNAANFSLGNMMVTYARLHGTAATVLIMPTTNASASSCALDFVEAGVGVAAVGSRGLVTCGSSSSGAPEAQ